jgi:flagellar basal-body rod protein FlgG
MNRGIYATATGMMAAQTQLDVVTHNLANAGTTGFKQDGVAFAERFERQLRANGGLGPAIGSLGSGATLESYYTDFEPGPLKATSNPLDLAALGPKGLFAVQTPQGVRYTRDGSFKLNDAGQLANQAGYPVLDPRGMPIGIEGGKVLIQEDGNVLVDGKEAGQIGIYDGSFMKVGDNLYESADAKAIEGVQVKAGHLEGSNVNAIEAMTGMITLNRAFELAQKSIQQQDELMQRLIQSLQDQ